MKLTDFLREVFAFVVPGAALLLLLPAQIVGLAGSQESRPPLLPDDLPLLDAALLFFVAYVLGAVLSGVGSVLDDLAERQGGGEALFSFIPSIGASKRSSDARFANLKDLAKRLEAHILAKLPEQASGPAYGYRAFWWNFLRTHHPRAAAEVDRLEAQQKMFRSFTVAAFVLGILYLLPIASIEKDANLVAGLAFLAASFGSFIYYASVRHTTARRLLQLAVVLLVPSNVEPVAEEEDDEF